MQTKNPAIVKPLAAAALLCIACAGASAQAQSQAQAEAQTHQPALSSDQIKAEYKADMKKCDGLKGNDQDVCEEQAKARRKAAEADAEYGKTTSEARQKDLKEKRAAGYDVAKEKCDSLSGDAKDQCIADAKSRYGK